MKLRGSKIIPATIENTWWALREPAVLRECIPGCESLGRTADGRFDLVLRMKAGPIDARMKGIVELQDIEPLSCYEMSFKSQSGVASSSQGHARVNLSASGEFTILTYSANVHVGRGIARIGSRIVDTVAAILMDRFLQAFVHHMTANGISGSRT
jgi:carbon monoxide dehydrogenase subunit G